MPKSDRDIERQQSNWKTGPMSAEPTLPVSQPLEELKSARTAWHEDFGVPINLKYARFLTAVGMVQNALAERARELQQAREQLDRERKLVVIGGDIFETSRNELILHQATELEYLRRAESAEQSLSEAREEIARLKEVEENLADYASRFFRLFDQYRGAWLREMGGVIRPKHWEIDGFALRVRDPVRSNSGDTS